VTSVPLRSAVGIVASASLALAVLTAFNWNGVHSAPGPLAASDLVGNAASPAAQSSPEPGTAGTSAGGVLGPAPASSSCRIWWLRSRAGSPPPS